MAAYNPRAARKARRQVRRLRRRLHNQRMAARQQRDDITAPLTGQRYRQEERAAERQRFGPQRRELGMAMADEAQTAADRARYYDDYRQALRESTARINAANAANVQASQSRVDSSYAQDEAALKARDAAQSEKLRKIGAGPTQSEEGARAIEAQRSQGNQSTDRLRGQASSDTKYMELRGATAALAKAEDQGRLTTQRKKLREEGRQLAKDRGDFRTNFRANTRKSEREWKAIEQEFGLNKKRLSIEAKSSRADRALEQQKLNTQKIVARIYASADRAGARAQVRIARINLRKGKISQRQYREIVNIYRGLPKKGQPGGSAGPKPLTVTEEKTVKQAFKRLSGVEPPIRMDQKRSAINQLIGKYGYPPRIAREAWKRYALKAPGMPPGESGPH